MTYTITIEDSDGKTVYEQLIDSDAGLVKAVVKTVISYTPQQLNGALAAQRAGADMAARTARLKS